jgi:hypothetical protein
VVVVVVALSRLLALMLIGLAPTVNLSTRPPEILRILASMRIPILSGWKRVPQLWFFLSRAFGNGMNAYFSTLL